jgi:hypothetical protein
VAREEGEKALMRFHLPIVGLFLDLTESVAWTVHAQSKSGRSPVREALLERCLAMVVKDCHGMDVRDPDSVYQGSEGWVWRSAAAEVPQVDYRIGRGLNA